MAHLFRRARKVGLPPGTVEYVGPRRTDEVRITLIDYDKDAYEEKRVDGPEACFPFRDTAHVSWINVDGLHETDVLESLGQHFGLHPLVVEDIAHTSQRPKLEDFGDYLYLVARMIYHDAATGEISTEQISFVLGQHYLLTFQERPGDVFEAVRERVRRGKGRARKLGPDYLAYALLDAIVDHYFVVLEKVGDEIEALEVEMMEDPTTEVLAATHRLKREGIVFRRAVWPLRDVVSGLVRTETPLIKKNTVVFVRDVYDHIVQVADIMESFRDVISGLQDLYNSSMSNRMNEVMKVLTIIATIFVPLTFVAGIYGMNFEFMPELKWKWAYFGFWGVILAIGIAMLIFFRRRRWL